MVIVPRSSGGGVGTPPYSRVVIFFFCLIIAYILGSNHELSLNPDFWVDLRGGMIAPPLALNSYRNTPR